MTKDRDKKGKPTKPVEAVKRSGAMRGAAEPQTNDAVFSRWASFEQAVLSKVNNPEQCKEVIAQRQVQVDDDSNEADLIVAFIRRKLQDKNENPDTCCVYFTTSEITACLHEATGTKLPINKATPHLRALAIVELRYTKKNGVPGWVWRGRQADINTPARVFSKLGYVPRGRTISEA
jgi:hypothetical protein